MTTSLAIFIMVCVPIIGGYSEVVNVEFHFDFMCSEVWVILVNIFGVIVQDDSKNNIYSMLINVYGRDEVFVGRIRRDEFQPNTFNMWVVFDNLRKGAVTNAVQIAEFMMEKSLVY